jgi:pimeloyl-ACP methyl ester carboxylesterase
MTYGERTLPKQYWLIHQEDHWLGAGAPRRTVLGDGGVPLEIANAVNVPVLLLVGAESAAYKHSAIEDLVKALPRVELVTIDSTGFEPTDEQIARMVRHLG